MPLQKTPTNKARQNNFLAELSAGKPKKQALAIAYDVQKRAAANKPTKR